MVSRFGTREYVVAAGTPPTLSVTVDGLLAQQLVTSPELHAETTRSARAPATQCVRARLVMALIRTGGAAAGRHEADMNGARLDSTGHAARRATDAISQRTTGTATGNT